MSERKYPLTYLLPYLGRYRFLMVLGFCMVILTVVASMFSPWVLKYVIDGLNEGFDRARLLQFAAIILGISLVEGFFRFWMRRILIGVSRLV